MFAIFGKDGHRQIPKNRLMKSWKSWICDQYLSKNMNGFLLIWYEYLLQNKKWNFGNIQMPKILTPRYAIFIEFVVWIRSSSKSVICIRSLRTRFWKHTLEQLHCREAAPPLVLLSGCPTALSWSGASACSPELLSAWHERLSAKMYNCNLAIKL